MMRLRVKWPYDPWSCSCCGRRVDGAPPSSVLSGLACDPCLERGGRGEPYVPLTVRLIGPPAKPEQRPIVAVSMRAESCALESGETFGLRELVDRVRERKRGEIGRRHNHELPDRLPESIVVTDNSLELLAYLDGSPAADSPFWQWQISIRAGGPWRPEATARRPRAFLTARPVRFGYASRRGNRTRAKGRSLWYLLLDPHDFCELPDGWGRLDLVELVRFGTELRGWSNHHQLPVFASVSAYGSRLLRDARFGGGWRRKIPAATNQRLRRALPGNHYQLMTATDKRHAAVHKYDQAGAHHHAALMSRFPHPDLLDARGWFRRPPPADGSTFRRRGPIRAGTREWRELLDHAGVFTIAVSVPERVAIDSLHIPALRTAGHTWQTLTSAEVDHARHVPGVRLLDIWSCWTSPQDDDRLREYALWAGGQLRHASPLGRGWLKPLLLATYGMLAVRPSRFRNAWRWAYRSDGAVGWTTHRGQLIGQERAGRRDTEPGTANVLWRAIIESRVRLESLTFARDARQHGYRPLAVYADAVFVTQRPTAGDRPAPLTITPPWRYDGIVHDLVFDGPARYRSREETRLPGTPRSRDRLANPFA